MVKIESDNESRSNPALAEKPNVDRFSVFAPLIDASTMLACPNCGKVSLADSKGVDKCSCGAQLLLKKEVLAQVNANKTLLRECLNFSEEAANNPGLDFLSYRRLDMNPYSIYGVSEGASNLTMHSTFKDEMLDFIAESIQRKLIEKVRVISAIAKIDDEAWSVTSKRDGTSEEVNVTVFFAHPNGNYTAITISRNTFSWKLDDPNYRIDVRRFDDPPTTEDELQDVLDAIYYDGDIVSSNSDTNVEASPDPIKRYGGHRKSEYLDILDNLDRTEQVLSALILEKFKRVLEQNEGKEVFVDSSKIEKEQEAVMAQELFAGDYSREGHSISCANCGAPNLGQGQQVSFFRCTNCHSVNDLVEQNKLSPDLLQAREASESFIPADYFLDLLGKVEKDGGPELEVVLNILSSEKTLSGEQEIIFADAISRIASDHPHLMAYYEFQPFDDRTTYSGGVMNISFPTSFFVDNSKTGGPNYSKFGIPKSLRGKILTITFGDFDNEGQKDTWNRWGRVRTTIFDLEGFDERFGKDVNSWGKQHIYDDEITVEDHWAESGEISVDSGLKKPDEGPIYDRIKLAMAHMPPNNYFLNSARN